MKSKMLEKDKIQFLRYSLSDELRASESTDGEGHVIEGYAIVYEQEALINTWSGDQFYEIIKRGALDGADLTDVPLFIHHKGDDIPLARSRRNSNNSTLKLTPDDKGLHFRAVLDVDNNSEAKALYSAIKRGDITGMSYSFRVMEEKWLNLNMPIPTREIYRFKKIGEISSLWSPAYEGTSIEARGRELDSSDKLALDNARSALDNEKKELEFEVEKQKLKIKFGGHKQ